MIAGGASREGWLGRSGLSLASMKTASSSWASGLGRLAAANMGSVIMLKAAAAEAAPDRRRKDRREKSGRVFAPMESPPGYVNPTRRTAPPQSPPPHPAPLPPPPPP